MDWFKNLEILPLRESRQADTAIPRLNIKKRALSYPPCAGIWVKQNSPPHKTGVTTSQNENGSVFFYILLAVALFAALSYTVSNNKDGNVNIYDEEQAKLAAQEIIEYGNNVANAVQKLQLRGCSDTKISFENNIVSGYENPNSPTDKSCHVFDINGGNIEWQTQSKHSIDQSNNSFNDYIFIGNNVIIDIGDFASELIMFAEINNKTCEFINTLMNNTPVFPPIFDSNGINMHSSSQFDGNYNTFDVVDAYGPNVMNACFFDDGTGRYTSKKYIYYQVLIAR